MWTTAVMHLLAVLVLVTEGQILPRVPYVATAKYDISRQHGECFKLCVCWGGLLGPVVLVEQNFSPFPFREADVCKNWGIENARQ